MRRTAVFRIPVLSAIVLQLAQAATQAMFSFGIVVPGLRSALRLQSTPHPPQTGYAIKIP